jgi:hypothetical protein
MMGILSLLMGTLRFAHPTFLQGSIEDVSRHPLNLPLQRLDLPEDDLQRSRRLIDVEGGKRVLARRFRQPLDALEDFARHSGRGLGKSDNPPSSFASIPVRWGVSLSGHAPESIFRDCRQCHDRQEPEYSTICPRPPHRLADEVRGFSEVTPWKRKSIMSCSRWNTASRRRLIRCESPRSKRSRWTSAMSSGRRLIPTDGDCLRCRPARRGYLPVKGMASRTEAGS